MKTLAALSISALLLVAASALAQDSRVQAPPSLTNAAGNPVASPGSLNEADPPLAVRPVKPALPPHKFFDLKNSLAIGAFGVALAADSYSTQRGLAYPGVHEANPLARPFVASRGGQIAYSGTGFALFAGGMYLAHRTGHHRIERIAPWIAAGWEAALAGWNMHQVSLAQASK